MTQINNRRPPDGVKIHFVGSAIYAFVNYCKGNANYSVISNFSDFYVSDKRTNKSLLNGFYRDGDWFVMVDRDLYKEICQRRPDIERQRFEEIQATKVPRETAVTGIGPRGGLGAY